MINLKNRLTLFFSLPFYPSERKNMFLHGHISLGIEDRVYQIFNPYLLKSDFLVSIMPVDEWLYNDSSYWVDRDKKSKTYRYVHLYRKSELKRTTVFYCSFKVEKETIEKANSFFSEIEKLFKYGKLKFRVFKDNCSGLIADFFYKERLIKRNFFNFIPFLFFKKVIVTLSHKKIDFVTGILFKEKNMDFNIHNFCWPYIYKPEKTILKWIKKYNFIDNIEK
ncbi:MAG TPA: hypothetical protein PLE45_08380 [Spirochaetota bacterium]|nr:hypothetical protein [Spirochaetota bacterium]HOL57667.1 hypothetical protein [Spirochaetota bacterium]HPP04757.1 hypothetical protein [Spirochaetota bacterium]